MLAAFSGWAWLRVRPSQFRTALTYAGFAISLAYTHYFGVLMVAAQGISALWRERLDRERVLFWLKTYGLITLAYLPWAAFLVVHPLPPNSYSTIKGPPPLSEISIATRELFGSSAVNSILALLLGIFAIAFTTRRRWAVAVFAWVFLEFYISWAISRLHPVYAIRYYLVALSPLLAVSAVGAYELRRWHLTGFATVLFCVLGLHETIFARHFYSHAMEQDTRSAARAGVDYMHAHPQAAAVTMGLPIVWLNYYMQQMHAPTSLDMNVGDLKGIRAAVSRTCSAFNAPEIILIAMTENKAEIDALYAGLPAGYHVVDHQDFYKSTAAYIVHSSRE